MQAQYKPLHVVPPQFDAEDPTSPDLAGAAGFGEVGPSVQAAIAALVTAEGDLDLASERLYGPPLIHNTPPNYIPPKGRLVALISSDPSSFNELQKQLRTLSLLRAFSSVGKVATAVDGTLHFQEGKELVKLYSQLLTVIATLTDDHTVNSNINGTLSVTEQIMSNVPPEIREALKVLMLKSAGSNAPSLPDAPPYKAAPTDQPPSVLTDIEEDSDDWVEQQQRLEQAERVWSGGNPPPNAARTYP